MSKLRLHGKLFVISGEVGAFLSRRGSGPSLGPRDITESATYALRLAPDRVLYVSDAEQAIDLGWSEAGYAVADMTDGIILFDVSGARCLELLQQGTGYDFLATDARPTESANILLAGLRVAIFCRPDGWRLHIERHHATALWTWLQQVMRLVP